MQEVFIQMMNSTVLSGSRSYWMQMSYHLFEIEEKGYSHQTHLGYQLSVPHIASLFGVATSCGVFDFHPGISCVFMSEVEVQSSGWWCRPSMSGSTSHRQFGQLFPGIKG